MENNFLEIFGMNNIIQNCIISNFTEGIFINIKSKKNIIKNNKLILNRHGIYLDHSSNNTIFNNLISNNIFSGIYDKESVNTTVIDNDLYENNDSGIYLSRTKDTRISDNNITKNVWGVSIISSINVTIVNNHFFNSFNAYDDSEVGMIKWNLNETAEETEGFTALNQTDSGIPTGGFITGLRNTTDHFDLSMLLEIIIMLLIM